VTQFIFYRPNLFLYVKMAHFSADD